MGIFSSTSEQHDRTEQRLDYLQTEIYRAEREGNQAAAADLKQTFDEVAGELDA